MVMGLYVDFIGSILLMNFTYKFIPHIESIGFKGTRYSIATSAPEIILLYYTVLYSCLRYYIFLHYFNLFDNNSFYRLFIIVKSC